MTLFQHSYALVVSLEPSSPLLYIYLEGIARFCTLPFSSPHTPLDLRRHLTNTTLQKAAISSFSASEEQLAALSGVSAVLGERFSAPKWTLSDILHHISNDNHDEKGIVDKGNVEKDDNFARKDVVWQRISNVVRETLLPLPQLVPQCQSANCFELLGFDILLDDRLEAHLLEVNTSPSLGIDGETDNVVKRVRGRKKVCDWLTRGSRW